MVIAGCQRSREWKNNKTEEYAMIIVLRALVIR
jgi:hypothetical protein